MRLLAEDAHLMPTAPVRGALVEIIPVEQQNIDTVQNWCQSCKRIHGGFCEISKTGPTQERFLNQLPELQALDMYAQKMCIKFTPVKYRYFTLSYI